MRLFHRTHHAAAILREGFRDGEGSYLTDRTLRGVWLSDFPLDENAGADGDQLLQVDVPDAVALDHEVVEEGKTYREFLIPADVLNRCGPPRLVSADEEGELTDPRFLPPSDVGQE